MTPSVVRARSTKYLIVYTIQAWTRAKDQEERTSNGNHTITTNIDNMAGKGKIGIEQRLDPHEDRHGGWKPNSKEQTAEKTNLAERPPIRPQKRPLMLYDELTSQRLPKRYFSSLLPLDLCPNILEI